MQLNSTTLRTSSLLLWLAGLTSCVAETSAQPTVIVPEVPATCMEVRPAELAFTEVDLTGEPSAPQTLAVTVHSSCDGGFELNNPQIDGRGFALGPSDGFLVTPDQPITIPVRFEPTEIGEHDAHLVVNSNASDRPTQRVRLSGLALGPAMRIDPSPVRMPDTPLGCRTYQTVEVRNVGTRDLDLFDVSTVSHAGPAMWSSQPPLPASLAPYNIVHEGPTYAIEVGFRPTQKGTSNAVLRLLSADPSQPERRVTITGEGTAAEPVVQRFDRPLEPTLDVLFTLDRTGSMYDRNVAFIGHSAAFAEQMNSQDVDYRAAVVVADSGCVLGPDLYIDSSFSAADVRGAFGTMADQDRALSPYGSNTERPFMLVEAALAGPTCNKGLFRPDASLHLVHLSDEPEQSVHPWSHYVAQFDSLKPKPNMVIVNAIAGDHPSGCPGAAFGSGYYEATMATGGEFLSVCAPSMKASLQAMAIAISLDRTRFVLDRRPVIETLRVVVDGEQVDTWTYDAAERELLFAPHLMPPPGSSMVVHYIPQQPC